MRLTRVFLESDLRCGFEGLRLIAEKSGIDLKKNTVMFINTANTGFKLLANDTYCVYYKNGHRKIPLDALRFLPEAFGGSKMEMESAVRKSLESKLGVRA